MREHLWIVLLVGVAVLEGCGKSDKATGTVAKSAPSTIAASADQAASAEDVAKQARGDVSCPPKLATPPRAETAPVDDILGVRPGQSYDEAVNGVLCANPLLVAVDEPGRGFDVKSFGQKLRQGFGARFAEPRVVKSGKQIVQEMQNDAMGRGMNRVREDLKPGQSKWYVGTMGVPGAEQVLSVAREERFAEDQMPTNDTVRAALLKKYGPATLDQPASAARMAVLRWAYDPQGRPIEPGTPPYPRRLGPAAPNHGANVTPDCGVVVDALLIPPKANAALVERLQVGVVDQARGYRLLKGTEDQLAQLDQQRRAQEVDKAAKNTKAPSL